MGRFLKERRSFNIQYYLDCNSSSSIQITKFFLEFNPYIRILEVDSA